MSKIKPVPDQEPAHDLLRARRHPLDIFFSPKTVALIGASENPESVGRTILRNLITSPFGGVVFPVNPKRSSVLGIRAYPKIGSLPPPVDLAALAQLLVRFSRLVVEQRWIREIDINRLLSIGRDERLKRIRADILLDNAAMRRVCRKLGFRLHREVGDPMITAEIEL